MALKCGGVPLMWTELCSPHRKSEVFWSDFRGQCSLSIWVWWQLLALLRQFNSSSLLCCTGQCTMWSEGATVTFSLFCWKSIRLPRQNKVIFCFYLVFLGQHTKGLNGGTWASLFILCTKHDFFLKDLITAKPY